MLLPQSLLCQLTWTILSAAGHRGAQGCAKLREKPASPQTTTLCQFFLGIPCKSHSRGMQNHWETSLKSLLFKMIPPALLSQVVIKNYSPLLISKGQLDNDPIRRISCSRGFSLFQESTTTDL